MAAFRLSRRAVAIAGVLMLALTTSACFDDEPAERRAFIAFLQARIIDRPGLHIPIMTKKEIEDCGRYAPQYKILNGFHHAIDASISGELARAMAFGSPRSLAELGEKRATIGLIHEDMIKFKAAIEQAQAAAEAARKKLDLPHDLKRVYDIAFERMVSKPARVFLELAPMIESSLPAIERLAAFLDNHRGEIDFRDGQPVARSEEVRIELAQLMEEAGRVSDTATEGKRKLRELAEGK